MKGPPNGENMKKIIGITGGIGSGKSTVLDLLEKNFRHIL